MESDPPRQSFRQTHVHTQALMVTGWSASQLATHLGSQLVSHAASHVASQPTKQPARLPVNGAASHPGCGSSVGH